MTHMTFLQTPKTTWLYKQKQNSTNMLQPVMMNINLNKQKNDATKIFTIKIVVFVR